MASSLSLSTPFPSLPSLYAPPPSQDTSMQEAIMPNVIVSPPEEEQHENPPWCYFHADDAAHEVQSTTPDIDALDTALSLQQQLDNRAPAFHRCLQNVSQETIVLPRKGSLAQLKENSAPAREPRRSSRSRVLDEDSEIVEVFKVRRNEGREDAGQQKGQMTKSKTFRARATDAFRSIKNVRKASRGPIPSTSGSSWSSGENVRLSEDSHDQGAASRSSAPNLSRRRSLVLSQLFTFSQNSKSAAEIDEHAMPISQPKPITALPHRRTMHTVPSLASPSEPHYWEPHPLPSLEDMPITTPSRGISSHPTVSKRKSFRRRLSVLELQKLFTLNPSSSSSSLHDTQMPDVPVDAFSPHGLPDIG
ncbi:predicted protein [Postia placenta Mad-698-R]|uniref:Uncharacterized protein n=1 Tax=Postia placenta MAD-698-R-SB12 TaxID=670580 RepID=A0A1X6N8P3_9APHY|nr:hypothetical protein POSPLADRAFT_1064997 [Postia placenta MAD-698-R-SB12]EED78538.1 predicted protein [Postia placenta Mad-698-R]OSX64944.1 hypothetical protein POSPLADRAFT_1064997 [Postia placenta MAD-698-R-SB12]